MSAFSSNVSVVIPAQNEEGTIANVIGEIRKLKPLEVIVVLNGSTDATKQICQSLQCKIYEFQQPLGHDVGRAIGAFYAKGEIVLFLDGDIPVSSQLLKPFVQAIERGHDIALNNLTWAANLPGTPHYTTLAKKVLNRMMGRIDLSANSLLAVPHAMSKKAIEQIGWKNIAAPIVAQAIAIDKKLTFTAPVSVNVIDNNKQRAAHTSKRSSPFPESTERILGDHLEALQWWTERRGERGGKTDGARKREFLRFYTAPERPRKAKRSAIIPAGEERETIRGVIRSARDAGADEIIVVANGADDATVQIAMETGASVLVFNQRLGHNVGRAVGAAFSTGDALLFIDGDFVIPPDDLSPFFHAVENGVDVALNRLTSLCGREFPLDVISAVKYFLNCCLKRPDLLNGSMTAVPHAISRSVLQKVGFRSLMLPPLAQAKALLAGLRVENVHFVDVITPNRIREDHTLKSGTAPAFERIVGDHIETLDYYLKQTDRRGGFHDGSRRRSVLDLVEGRKS